MADLRIVTDDHGAPLPYEEGNALFQKSWADARLAYASLMPALGGIAHPLFIKNGPVNRQRVKLARYEADRIAKYAAEIASSLATAQEAFDRAIEYARQNGDRP